MKACILIALFSLGVISNSPAQICDSITKSEFFKRVAVIANKMQAGDSFSINGLLRMVKTYNTTQLTGIVRNLDDQQMIKRYKKLFEKKYMRIAMDRLECTYGKGMTIYSPKYDIYVGVGSVFRCNDIYRVL